MILLNSNPAFTFSTRKTMKAVALFAVLGLALAPSAFAASPHPPIPTKGLAKFKFGDTRMPLAQIEEQIRKSSPAQYKDSRPKLLAVLKAPRRPRTPSATSVAGLAVVSGRRSAFPRWPRC